ncbi:MAG: right-handed parallel beta-helix repeat-containing protein [Candidatus Eisenbacteria bacterium]
MRTRGWLALVPSTAAALTLACATLNAATLTVGPAGDHASIQAALTAAAPGDTVLVAAGTYSGGPNTNLDFAGKGVTLLSEGGAASTAIDCQGAARAFSFTSGEDTTSVVRGFTIAYGYDGTSGGAVYCYGSSPKLAECRFVWNAAGTAGSGGLGGAVYVEQSQVVVQDCLFRDNTADDGAGMFARNSVSTVRGTSFVDNVATNGGGGLRILYNGGTITRCTFAGNTAPTYGGGVYFCYSSPVFRNCTLAYNAASQGGAAYGFDATPTFTNCIVAHSTEGTAFYCPGTSVFTIDHCCVYGNEGGDEPCGNASDNIFEDPLLCASTEGVLTLEDCSPCLGAGQGGGDIGAWGIGCLCGSSSGIPEDSGTLALGAAPNPLHEWTTFTFVVPPGGSQVDLLVYDARGRQVAALASGRLSAGPALFAWDGRSDAGSRVASGVYFARLALGGLHSTAKLVLLR